MIKKFNWQIAFGVLLIVLSALLYLVHFLIFRDLHHIWIYLVGDIAFVPIEVLLVTLIIHRLLDVRGKRAVLNKLNMVIGAFFSEVGTDLLKRLSEFCSVPDEIKQHLVVRAEWSDKDFARAGSRIATSNYEMDSSRAGLKSLCDVLVQNKGFMIRLLENPNLLEHETFTDLLWAVFHLTEELAARESLTQLPESDFKHISGDMQRAYGRLIVVWLDYMKHLRTDYPYLFSLAIRTNPCDPNASVTVA